MLSRGKRVLWSLAGALVVVAAVNLILFGSGLYRPWLDPASSVGSFELTIDRLQRLHADRRRDVLVLGDSRVLSALDRTVADASGGTLRFQNAAVPGTTPRCWSFATPAVDPDADRFRAVVIPVDTYADDDSAEGSADGDNRLYDLRFIVFRVALGDVLGVARTFGNAILRLQVAIDLFLRGPELRDDVQAFVADPAQRMRDVRAEWNDPRALAPNAVLQRQSLAGLRVDFARNEISFPSWIAPAERREIAAIVLAPARPSPTYAAYRREWLGAIVARYRAAGTPVIFVRIPTRPMHRAEPGPPSGSLAQFARDEGVRFLPQAPFVALERPELFGDHDHLNAEGARQFSRLLGAGVAAVLGERAAAPHRPFSPADPTPASRAPATVAAQRAAAMSPNSGPAPRALAGAALPFPSGVLFQSYDFFLFFIALCVTFYAAPRRFGRAILLIASYAFYASWNQWYVVMLLALTATDYLVARALEDAPARRRRMLLVLGVGANVGFLGVLKYANFTTGTLAALLGMPSDPWVLSLIVPVGISFHTFQSISYVVDVYRGRIAAVRNPFDYALYIAFFPQLLAGPIVRAGRFFGELFHWQPPAAEKVALGVGEMLSGLIKKTVLADHFAKVSDVYFGAVPYYTGTPEAWSGALAFALQIYFDFSGYSDIAIGSARLLGFDFPENFHRPYLAWSIPEFWRRWHMTLSSWLRDYLYIPLGGNRNGTPATVRNITITMLLGGLWHGANWTFVAWGAYHGALLSIERLVRGERRLERPRGGMRVVATLVTFALVLFGWVIFRATNFADAGAVLGAMFAARPGQWMLPAWMVLLAAVAVSIEIAQERGASFQLDPLSRAGQIAALSAGLIVLELLSVPSDAAPFVYFKF